MFWEWVALRLRSAFGGELNFVDSTSSAKPGNLALIHLA
jgi:hypothetical protein